MVKLLRIFLSLLCTGVLFTLPEAALAFQEYPILIARVDTPVLIASADYPVLIANSIPSPLLAGSPPRLFAGQAPTRSFLANSPLLPASLFSYTKPSLLFGPNGEIVPIQKRTHRTSWFNYGYTGRYYNPEEHTIWLNVSRLRTGLHLGYEFRNLVYSSSNGAENSNSAHKYFETLSLAANGWVYNPNLVKYTLRLEPTLTQHYQEINNENDNDNSFSMDYNLQATAFEYKPVSFQAFAVHEEESSWTVFKGTSDVTDNIFGGDVTVALNDLQPFGRIQSTFGYHYLDHSSEGFYSRSSENHNYHLQASQQSQRSNGRLQVKYLQQDYTYNDANANDHSEDTLDSYLQHYYYFDRNPGSNVQTFLSYFSRDYNDSSFENYGINESLHLWHTQKFRSHYRVGYKKVQLGSNSGSDTYDGEASLDHWLYENLYTNAGISSLYRETEEGETNTSVTPFLDFKYTRRIPWGDFSFLPGWSYNYTSRDFGGSTSSAAFFESENITAQYGMDIVLAQDRVDVNTIVVSSNDFSRTYTIHIDYEVFPAGNDVIIRILPLGDITDGESIVVQYRYSIDSSYDSGSFNQHYGIQFHLFNQLELYYFYNQIYNKVLSGSIPENYRGDQVSHRARAVYDYKWNRTDLTYTLRDDEAGADTSSLNLYQRFSFDLFESGDISFGFNVGTTEYGASETSDYYGTEISLRYRLANWCNLTFSGYYQESDARENRTNSGFRTTINFYYRIWRASLYWDYVNQELEGNRADSTRESNLIRFDIIRLEW